MSKTEAAWLAGIVDGEGSISITNKRGIVFTFQLSVSNTSLPLLQKILDVTGCGRLDTRAVASHEYWSLARTWAVGTANAEVLLKQILPWLIVKRERAEMALAQQRWEPGFGLSPGKAQQIIATYGQKKVTA